ncbi:unnamed protein product, partial [Ectocarpus sp. 8 AP-2014]
QRAPRGEHRSHKDSATAKQHGHENRKGVTIPRQLRRWQRSSPVTARTESAAMTDYCAPLRHHAAGPPPTPRGALGSSVGGDHGGNPGGSNPLHPNLRSSSEGPPGRTLGGNHDLHSRLWAEKDESQGSDREEGAEIRDEFFNGYTGTESEDESESAEVGEGNLRDHSAGYSRFEQEEEETTVDGGEEQHERKQSMNPGVTGRSNGDATGGGSSSNGGSSGSSSLKSHQLRAPQHPEQAEEAERQQQQQQEPRAVEGARARGPMAPPGNSIISQDTQEPSHLSQGDDIYEQATQQPPPRASGENEKFDQQTQEQSPQRPRQERLQEPEDEHQQHQQEICGLPGSGEAQLDAEEHSDDGVSDYANDDESTSKNGRSGRASGCCASGDRTGAGATDSSDPIGSSSFEKPDNQATSAFAADELANRLNEVGDGRASSGRVDSRSSGAERKGGEGDMKVTEGAEDMGSGEDENLPEEELAVVRDQREREAIIRQKVGDGFLKITNSYMTASSAIKGVEAEQARMIKGENEIKEGLTKFSLRVRKATDALQTQLLAALRGEPIGAEEETPLTAELAQRDRVCTGMIGEHHDLESTGHHSREESTASASSTKPPPIVNHGERRAALSLSSRRATSGATAAGSGGRPLAGTRIVNSSIMRRVKFNCRRPSDSAEVDDGIGRASRRSSSSAIDGLANGMPSRQEQVHLAAGQSDCGSATTNDTMNGMGSTNGTDMEDSGLARTHPLHAAAALGCSGGGGGGGGGGVSSSGIPPAFPHKRPRLNPAPQLAQTREKGATVGPGGWTRPAF